MSHASCRLRFARDDATPFPLLLTTSCSGRQALLEHAEVARNVLDTARWLDDNGKCRLYACVVMPDHAHLVLRILDSALSTVMESFKGYSARRTNKILQRSGSVWQPGFHDAVLGSTPVFERAIRYCLENPVRAGLVNDWREWPHSWSRWDP